MPKIPNYLFSSGMSREAYDFLESSKLTEYDILEFTSRLPAVMTSRYYMDQIVNHTPELGFCEKVPLKTKISTESELMKIQKQRKSTRRFADEGITLEELSDMLNLSYCITNPNSDKPLAPARNIATAGGLYPVDMFVINRKVQGLEKGVYYYNIVEECLELISDTMEKEEVENLIERALFTNIETTINHSNASGYIILGATLNRVCFKYQDRGIWFALIDTGAIMHSVYLACASLNIGCCAMGGHIDNLIMKLIGYEGNSQAALGTIVFGKMK